MTYARIQEYVKEKHGFTPKTCWIADVKAVCGLPVRTAWNREGKLRKHPCPEDKAAAIKEAIRWLNER